MSKDSFLLTHFFLMLLNIEKHGKLFLHNIFHRNKQSVNIPNNLLLWMEGGSLAKFIGLFYHLYLLQDNLTCKRRKLPFANKNNFFHTILSHIMDPTMKFANKE